MSNLTATSSSDFPVKSPRLSPRAAAGPVILVLAGLGMIAAAVIVIVGMRGGVSLPLLSAALTVCRGLTGLLGLLTLASPLLARGSDTSLRETFSTIAWGAAMVAAAVVGLGLVVAVTGLLGFGLTVGGLAAVRDAYVGSARPTR